ncbi:MAG: exodeoxyribonuclease VII small subunit [Saccharofermentans sp.]|nr:exodeoxyribonuclease VII small subunit [Saccharofermentans sp.]
MEDKNFNYEEAMTELNSIVSKLQNGSVSLDDSLALYTRGVELAAKCDAKIKDIEQKIAMVNANGDEEPFDVDPGEI